MLQTDNPFFLLKLKKIVYSRNAHAQNSEVVHEIELAIKYVIRLFAIMISISQSNHHIFKVTTNKKMDLCIEKRVCCFATSRLISTYGIYCI